MSIRRLIFQKHEINPIESDWNKINIENERDTRRDIGSNGSPSTATIHNEKESDKMRLKDVSERGS
jgi:hypothetical protein